MESFFSLMRRTIVFYLNFTNDDIMCIMASIKGQWCFANTNMFCGGFCSCHTPQLNERIVPIIAYLISLLLLSIVEVLKKDFEYIF